MTAVKKHKTLIVWFRRNLRVADKAILKRGKIGAAGGESPLNALAVLNQNLQKRTGRLIIRRDKTPDTLPQPAQKRPRALDLYESAAQNRNNT